MNTSDRMKVEAITLVVIDDPGARG